MERSECHLGILVAGAGLWPRDASSGQQTKACRDRHTKPSAVVASHFLHQRPKNQHALVWDPGRYVQTDVLVGYLAVFYAPRC